MTKLNKELVEKTNVNIKYADQTAYVAGESEKLVLKVNDVTRQTLKQGKKAEIMSHLARGNYKMAYEDASGLKLDNEAIIYSTSNQELLNDAGKRNAQCDKSDKLHLTKMPLSTAQQAADL